MCKCDVSTPIQFTTLKKKSILFGLVKIILGYQNTKSACLKGHQGFFNFANPGMGRYICYPDMKYELAQLVKLHHKEKSCVFVVHSFISQLLISLLID